MPAVGSLIVLWTSILLGGLIFPSEVRADSIVEILNGEQHALVDGVCVIKNPSEKNDPYLRYLRLQDGKFLREDYKRDPGNSLREVRSSASIRQAMLKEWKDAGWTVEVRDLKLRNSTLYNFCIQPTPPKGKAFIEHPDCFEQIVIATTPNPSTVTFDKIDRIKVDKGLLTIRLLDGTTVEGVLADVDYRGAQCGQEGLAYENYGPTDPKPTKIHFETIREIRFVRQKANNAIHR